MKNYASSKEEKEYILNYKIDENNIIVYKASGDTEIYPFCIENEKMILERMKNQVINLKDTCQNKKEMSYAYLSSGILVGLLCIASVIMWPIFHVLLSLFIMGLVVLGPTSIYSFIKSFKLKSAVKDIEKMLLFISKENKINDTMKDENISDLDICENLSPYAREDIRLNQQLSIADMDNFSYKDVAKMIENITLSNKSKVLVKKKGNGDNKC